MSEPNRPSRAATTDPRILASLIVAAGTVAVAVAIAAILSAGAEARSASSPAISSPPTISGAAVAGETLTASTGSWTGSPTITFAYAWQRCDAAGGSCAPIGGADEQAYVVVAGDVGSTLRVEVTATNAEGSASALSEPTALVTEPTAPVNAGEPAISGSAVEGVALTTTTGTWTGAGTISYGYQWVRCDSSGGLPDGSNCPSIPGATSSSYTLTTEDIGNRLRVQVTVSNVAGASTVASNPTEVVAQSTTTGPPRNTVEPSISGAPTRGRALFASVGTWAGATPITYTRQWVRCGTDGGLPDGSNCTFISGATASSYIPTVADVGQRLRIRVTASSSAGVQTVASNATAEVGTAVTAPAQAPRNTFLPSISGTAALGRTLFSSVGVWTGTRPLTYTYQWLRCDADGSSCEFVSAATIAQYTPTTADVGQRLRVRVTARNGLGTAAATSSASAQVLSSAATPSTPSVSLPQRAVRLADGDVSIPVASVSLPERLVVGDVAFRPGTVRSRERPFQLRVRVVDTRGYAVRDALVFARSTPLVTHSDGEVRSGRDGWAVIRLTPRADFPLRTGHSVQFWIRVRKQGEDVLAGVSNRRLVQVATAT